MAELKTKPTAQTAESFLNNIADAELRKDCYTIAALMEKATGEPATMWGTAIVGFDKYHYKYASGHEGDMCLVGFSPRKSNISLYLMLGGMETGDLMQKLGKHKMGKGCLYIKKLTDVNIDVLDTLIINAVKNLKAKYSA